VQTTKKTIFMRIAKPIFIGAGCATIIVGAFLLYKYHQTKLAQKLINDATQIAEIDALSKCKEGVAGFIHELKVIKKYIPTSDPYSATYLDVSKAYTLQTCRKHLEFLHNSLLDYLFSQNFRK
jgi:hypothetical protein